jgi:hypothetical protein
LCILQGGMTFLSTVPERPGRKIWGHERLPSFPEASNCKDTLFAESGSAKVMDTYGTLNRALGGGASTIQ